MAVSEMVNNNNNNYNKWLLAILLEKFIPSVVVKIMFSNVLTLGEKCVCVMWCGWHGSAGRGCGFVWVLVALGLVMENMKNKAPLYYI